ncbi:CoA-binding protein [Thermodesulfobacteriota bacterium]
MGQFNLNRIFKPRHVAVVGASEKAGTIGNALMRNLIDGGFSGTLLPVNSKYKTIHGHESFGSVSALETSVDLAIIATPIHSVVDIVSECVEEKVGGAVIISAGGLGGIVAGSFSVITDFSRRRVMDENHCL